MGYNSRQVENRTLQNKTALKRKRQLLFKGAGNSTLPLASTLHSYVPTIIFKRTVLELH
jgi:hypothetical protein